jgi:hypothetical protein
MQKHSSHAEVKKKSSVEEKGDWGNRAKQTCVGVINFETWIYPMPGRHSQRVKA